MKVIEKQQEFLSEHQLANLYQQMNKNHDEESARKIIDLFEKLEQNEFHVSFTGHFSAGKSSLINYLLKKDLLPKSPIPTSANIVKISSGQGVARVFFNEKKPIEYEEPYDIDMIKDYCMNKDTIRQINIQTSEAILPPHTAILDTPGIDAADDADRYMTESSLHVVDILYYVMDYNHVQSEVNLYFLQEIQKKAIPIYIIINQIDKHNEAELSFDTYSAQVKETFEQWGVFPKKIYYSSMKDKSAQHNELENIEADLFQLLNSPPPINEQVTKAAQEVIADHKAFLTTLYESKINEYSIGDRKPDLEHFQTLQNKVAAIDEIESKLTRDFSEELNQTLKNAYLMPAKLRDLAEQFLISQQKDFKIGFINAKKKTEVERQARLETFFKALNDSIQSTIEWQLRDKCTTILQNYQLTDESLLASAQNLTISYSEDDLFSFIKKGATINGNYILNYTNDISNDVKLKYKQQVNILLSNAKQALDNRVKDEKQILQNELTSYEKQIVNAEKQARVEEELQHKLEELHACMDNTKLNEANLLALKQILAERSDFVKEESPIIVQRNTDIEPKIAKDEENLQKSSRKVTAEQVVSAIEQVTEQINSISGFSLLVDELKEKRQRLENRELTIALFGAFSAGKSSFSNALLGEAILPVSPNPTTAVISRIAPVTEEHPHGTVIITFKSAHVLTSDLQMITKDLELEHNNFHDMVSWIRSNNIQHNDALTKTYQSYLEAILVGYDARKSVLGKTKAISLDEFAAFVTDESIACYIEAVDLYYDSSLTRNGITLVDTPGADSVNARHTNVAFDYIKEADAILYVTYYNHAVTSADRDFLMQLGRVKESFEMDKMFFIINAADLAESDDELSLVVRYVEEQLLQFGIRNPQIYPLSSKQSMMDKELGKPLNEQMATFEADFYTFIEKDLQALTMQAAVWDMSRARTRLENVIHSLTLDDEARKQHIKQLQDIKMTATQYINDRKSTSLVQRMEERIERQLHFVLERLYIRFHDLFTEHFNPTTITENGKQGVRQLERNRNHFIDYVGYELLQEIRAVSLRIESFTNTLFKDFYEQTQSEMTAIDDSLTLAGWQDVSFATPAYIQAFTTVDVAIFSNALKIFRNTKSFFEHEREKMKDAFYDAIKPEAEKYIIEQQKLMTDHYTDQLDKNFSEILVHIQNEVHAAIDQQIHVLSEVVDVGQLESKAKMIETVIATVKDENNEE